MTDITITQPKRYNARHYEAVARLLTQLTTRSIPFTPDQYRDLLRNGSTTLFLLQHKSTVIGMLTLSRCLIPTGCKGWIEDVVVDSDYRGQGLGRQLVSHAIEHARHEGYDSLMLTSAPKRIAANALYRALGFEHKETNVYTYPISR